MTERKSVLLRLDPAVHDALARWAADELRSTNAQIEFLLRGSLAETGRLPDHARPARRRGRPNADGSVRKQLAPRSAETDSDEPPSLQGRRL